MSNYEEIQLCERCDGAGIYTYDEHLAGHNSETITHKRTCAKCKGSGRILKKTSLSFEPYVPDKKITQ